MEPDEGCRYGPVCPVGHAGLAGSRGTPVGERQQVALNQKLHEILHVFDVCLVNDRA